MRGSKRTALLACALIACAAFPAGAHQEVDPAILRLVKPRTGQPPGNIVRPPGDPLVAEGLSSSSTRRSAATAAPAAPATARTTTSPSTPTSSRTLPPDDPLFVAETNPALAGLENPALMRGSGSFSRTSTASTGTEFVLRSVPHTLGLQVSLSRPARGARAAGRAPRLGRRRRARRGTLSEFAVGAVVQHHQELARRPGPDFRMPTRTSWTPCAPSSSRWGGGRRSGSIPRTEARPSGRRGDGRAAAVPRGAGADGSTRSCAGCHGNAGAAAGGGGLNADTGVRAVANAPAASTQRARRRRLRVRTGAGSDAVRARGDLPRQRPVQHALAGGGGRHAAVLPQQLGGDDRGRGPLLQQRRLQRLARRRRPGRRARRGAGGPGRGLPARHQRARQHRQRPPLARGCDRSTKPLGCPEGPPPRWSTSTTRSGC